MSVQDKKAPVLVVPDEVLQCLGTSMVFGNENKLIVFPSDKNGTGIANQKNSGGNSGTLHEVMWNTMLHNAVTRKLLNESHGIFVSLQKEVEDVESESKKLEVLTSTSRKYRSVVSVCHCNLLNHAEMVSDAEEKSHYLLQSELFYSMEVIWSLIEILFLDSTSGDFVLPQLLEWVLWHSDEGHKRVLEVTSFETVNNQPVYWEAVYIFVLQGNLVDGRKLLKLHQDATRDDFQSMDELLRKMPTYKSGRSVAEFSLQWKRWQEECSWRLDSGEFSSLPQLQVLAKILCGDETTICGLSHLCGSWYHTMVSWLLFTNPCVKGRDLAPLAKDCWEMFKTTEVLSEFDQILMNVFRFNLTETLTQLCYFPDSWWFVSHLYDLLYHHKRLTLDLKLMSEKPKSLREFLIINFASSLMSHSSLWQIGVDYLDTCSENGRQVMEGYLERIPLHTHSKVLAVLHVAEKRDMKNLMRNVCMVQAKKALSNNQIGTALSWAIRAGESMYVSHLADRLLQEYCRDGLFSDPGLLDDLGSSMLVSDRLTFLGKYREFHRLYESKDFKSAGDLLISLLASNLAPKYFWLTLLQDSIPLLEAKECIFSSQQTHQLLYCLQELDPGPGNIIQVLRLSLARNLARAFISEASST